MLKSKWMVLVVFGLLSGCAHARLESFHGNEYTVCCRHCSQDSWLEQQKNYCDGQSTLVGGHQNREISGVNASNYNYGAFAQGTDISIQHRTETCKTYQCSGHVNAD